MLLPRIPIRWIALGGAAITAVAAVLATAQGLMLEAVAAAVSSLCFAGIAFAAPRGADGGADNW